MSERRPLPHAPAKVRAELQGRLLDLLPRLGIKDQVRNGVVTPLNPRRADRHPGSFVIWTDGEGAGAWKDYAIGKQGDVFDLIEYLLGLREWIDAYWWALDFLGWERGRVRTAADDQLERQRIEDDRKAREAKARQEADAKGVLAFQRFLAAQPVMPGDPVWTYLTEARGLPMERLTPWPGALRIDPACEHFDRETGELTTWPAMISAMSRDRDGKVRAIHRTYLAPDGRSKAPVATAKKMWGVAEGCAIRVWRGAGKLTPEKAAANGVTGPLIVTEGIEDALTAAIAQPAYRVWAAGSLSLMGTLTWPPAASAVVLVADNDWDKPQAIAAFERTEAHWRAQARGRPLKVVRAQTGKDLNDWARGEQ